MKQLIDQPKSGSAHLFTVPLTRGIVRLSISRILTMAFLQPSFPGADRIKDAIVFKASSEKNNIYVNA
ncbi:hypothetical protein PV783_16095 [Chitinophaga sp. CC14]|uniref:hypothetical protein n=1 Tax=Chitinophaga sp. CC14 TaxID=3029199 RepID=UPI003B7C82D9